MQNCNHVKNYRYYFPLSLAHWILSAIANLMHKTGNKLTWLLELTLLHSYIEFNQNLWTNPNWAYALTHLLQSKFVIRNYQNDTTSIKKILNNAFFLPTLQNSNSTDEHYNVTEKNVLSSCTICNNQFTPVNCTKRYLNQILLHWNQNAGISKPINLLQMQNYVIQTIQK